MTSQVRHSGAGRNPAKTSIPHSGQNHNSVSQREKLSDCLDSGLRRNDGFGGYFK
jgi:hypothetical protein